MSISLKALTSDTVEHDLVVTDFEGPNLVLMVQFGAKF